MSEVPKFCVKVIKLGNIFEAIKFSGVSLNDKEFTTDRSHFNQAPYVFFYDCVINEFPSSQSLLRVAPNLTRLSITSSRLSKISRGDLKGLEKLTILTLSENELEYLPGDLFESTPNLEKIYLDQNKIRSIGEEILKPLKKLKIFDLSRNVNIDGYYNVSGGLTFTELENDIREKCKLSQFFSQEIFKLNSDNEKLTTQTGNLKVENQKLRARVGKMRYLINQSKAEKIRVVIDKREALLDKKLLAVNSPVLARLFKEDTSNILTLRNISIKTFKEIYKYMINKKPPATTDADEILEILAASVKLQMFDLKDKSLKLLKESVTEENCPRIMHGMRQIVKDIKKYQNNSADGELVKI